MNKFNNLVNNILLENKRDALLKWGKGQEVEEYLDLFMNNLNGIRLKVSSPYNNIDYWHSKRTFQDFKTFIDNFQSVRQIKKDKKYNLTLTDDGNGKLVDYIKDYEIWFVGSASAAIQLGRFYKGYSTKWCLCTDAAEYYFNNQYKNDTFYFLIRKEAKNNEFDKLAFQYQLNNEIKIWDLNNRKNTFNDFEIINYMKNNFTIINKLTDAEKYFKSPLLKIIFNKDNTVNLYGDIYLDDLNLLEVPWKGKFIINELFGDLNLNYNKLSSLKYFPKVIHGDLNMCDNNLISDNGNLELVEGNADFTGNNIKIFNSVQVNGILIK